jgi:two-component system chemotaxis response regulator CheB
MEKEGIRSTKMLLIGGSAGSLDVLLEILPAVRKDIAFSIAVILHRKKEPDSLLETLLSGRTHLPVKEAEDKEKILPATVYIAPPDYHLLVEKDGRFSLDASEKINFSRPSIDVSFESAADAFGSHVAGLLLSGANADGTKGLKRIKEAGGIAIVQRPSMAGVAYMPQQAINEVVPDAILKNEEIAMYLNESL